MDVCLNGLSWLCKMNNFKNSNRGAISGNDTYFHRNSARFFGSDCLLGTKLLILLIVMFLFEV